MRIDLSKVTKSFRDFIYNLPVAHIEEIQFLPSAQNFMFHDSSVSGVLKIVTNYKDGVVLDFSRALSGDSNEVSAYFAENVEAERTLSRFL